MSRPAPAKGSSSTSVFVGNIPYDVTEEKLTEVFSQVGQVLSFRLVYDRESGKPKGYGFCEYSDPFTALSAMRNLNGFEINGRHIRVDFAEGDKKEGPGTGGGTKLSGESAILAIESVVRAMSPTDTFELLSQLKEFALKDPFRARTMFARNPSVGHAVIQAQKSLGITVPSVQEFRMQQQQNSQHPGQPASGSGPTGPGGFPNQSQTNFGSGHMQQPGSHHQQPPQMNYTGPRRGMGGGVPGMGPPPIHSLLPTPGGNMPQRSSADPRRRTMDYPPQERPTPQHLPGLGRDQGRPGPGLRDIGPLHGMRENPQMMRDGPPPGGMRDMPPMLRDMPPPRRGPPGGADLRDMPPQMRGDLPPQHQMRGEMPTHQLRGEMGPPHQMRGDLPLPPVRGDMPPPHQMRGDVPHQMRGDLPPPHSLRDGPPPMRDMRDGPPPHLRDGPPAHMRDGPPPHMRDGPPPHLRDGPPPPAMREILRDGPPLTGMRDHPVPPHLRDHPQSMQHHMRDHPPMRDHPGNMLPPRGGGREMMHEHHIAGGDRGAGGVERGGRGQRRVASPPRDPRQKRHRRF